MSEAEKLSKTFDEKIEKIRKEFDRKLKSDGNGKELSDQLEEKLELLKEWVNEEIAKISEVLQEKFDNLELPKEWVNEETAKTSEVLQEKFDTQEKFSRTTDDASQRVDLQLEGLTRKKSQEQKTSDFFISDLWPPPLQA